MGMKNLPGGAALLSWILFAPYAGAHAQGRCRNMTPAQMREAAIAAIRVCTPGAKQECGEGEARGSRVCNGVGTAWGACVPAVVAKPWLLRSYGAKGDGASDDTAAIRKALAGGAKDLDGEGREYWINDSEISVPTGMTLRNLHLVAHPGKPADGQGVKILRIENANSVQIVNVSITVRPNNAGTASGDTQVDLAAVNASAVIWNRNSHGTNIEDVRVAGNFVGAAIRVVQSNTVRVIRPHIHDFYYSSPKASRYELILALWGSSADDLWIHNPRIENVGGRIAGGEPLTSHYQTDGITLSDTKRARIDGAVISRVGEGIDVTGSSGNLDFLIEHSRVEQVDVGIKVCNSAVRGLVRGNVVTDAGLNAFMVCGPSERGLPYVTSEITLDQNTAIRTGNEHWRNNDDGGIAFELVSGSEGSAYPACSIKNVVIKNSKSFGGPGTRYGFYNKVPGGCGNFVSNSDSSGHSVEGTGGYW